MAGQAKIKTIRLTISAIPGSPMLINAMSKQQLLDMRAKIKEVRDPNETTEHEAERKLYLPGDFESTPGVYGVPRVNLFASFSRAGRFLPFKGKSNISTAAGSTYLPMIVSFEPGVRFFRFDDHEITWKTTVTKGTNPNGGEAVVIVRPGFENWSITITIEIDETWGVTDKTIFKLINLAGKGFGLCDHRPECGGEAGMYKITAWETIAERDAENDEKLFFAKGPRKNVKRRDQILAAADAADAAAEETPDVVPEVEPVAVES